MYVPPHFAVTDAATLHAFIERYSFGLLVSQAGDRPFASHLPFSNEPRHALSNLRDERRASFSSDASGRST